MASCGSITLPRLQHCGDASSRPHRYGLEAMAAMVFLLFWLLAPGRLKAAEKITILTYHTHPPFVVGNKAGLSYDLAKYLTKRSAGRYIFAIRETSRPALNKTIDTSLAVVVPWVTPEWFADHAERKYLWSQQILMQEGNVLISRSDQPIVYSGPASLNNLIFGGLKGHVYEDIDHYIRDTQALRRVDANQHLENFHKLLQGRIDVITAPESAARYLIKREHLQEKLFLSPTLLSRYERRLFVTNRREDIRAFIDAAFSSGEAQQEWHTLLTYYQ